MCQCLDISFGNGASPHGGGWRETEVAGEVESELIPPRGLTGVDGPPQTEALSPKLTSMPEARAIYDV